MGDVSECSKRRFKALDELIKELDTNGGSKADPNGSSDDPEIKLMCEFWNILKEDPAVNLKQAVQQRMGLNAISSRLLENQRGCVSDCPNATKDECEDESLTKIKNKGSTEISETNCSTKMCDLQINSLPLNKVLCNLKEAACFEKKCDMKVNELLENQKQLQEQIGILEQKEKEGMQMLKQADSMWSRMEESYKQKITESLERQQDLLKQFKKIEASNRKWRDNKKELELEMVNINKCQQEVTEHINHKTNDVKCIDLEINNLKNRIETDNKDIEVALKSLTTKKQASDDKIGCMATEITKLEKTLVEEQKHKVTKEEEGKKYVKNARYDLQKLCKVLLQKKLENEDIKAEREALILEIEILNQTCDQCREKCENKQKSIIDEIKSIEKEIVDFRLRSTRCHECTDTVDVRKLCTDCPRCINVINEKKCSQEEGHCSPDHTMDCVCMTIKHKFLDNVFDNMYTLLERQVKTGQGNVVAEAVLTCLKKSRNGKINNETKKLLREFILTTIKKNLKLTIVGGAIKTRCEMDSETYNQLMLCLKDVEVINPINVDKGTDSKKNPCKSWGGSSQCNCPNGPNKCVCIGEDLLANSKALTCTLQVQGKEDPGEVVACPQLGSVETDVAAYRSHLYRESVSNFKNMRAAQCVLGPELLSTVSKSGCISPYINTMSSVLGNQATCKCIGSPTIPCVCHKDSKQVKAGIDDVCDKNKCDPITKTVDCRGNIHDLTTKRLKFECEEKNTLENTPKILKTSSGYLRVALNQKLLELLNTKIKNNCNLSTKLKNYKTSQNFADPLIDLSYAKSKISAKKSKALVKKSPSGNILLEVHKSLLKYEEKSTINLSSTETHNATKDRRDSSDILNVKVKGAHWNEKKTLFAIKATYSGNFEIFLDKEFEKWYKKSIKGHEGEDIEQYMPLTKTDSGNFIINLENNNENQLDSKSALMVKSESGNIKVIISKDDSEPLRKGSISKSVIFPQSFNDFLNKLPPSSSQFHKDNLKKARLISEKSGSDTYIYGKTKFNIQNASSGQFDVILNRDSKKSFVNNFKKYLTTSSKGLVPVERTDSGNIYVDLSNNVSSCASVKITPPGNVYITFDERTAFPSNYINRNSQNVKTNEFRLISTKKNSSCKEFATTCKPRDSNECNRKNICHKSKKRFLQSKDGSSETHPCGQNFLNTIHILKPFTGYGYKHKREKNVLFGEDKRHASDWNSLEYLTPQLPSFLRDHICF